MKILKTEIPPSIITSYEQWSRVLQIEGIDLFFNDILANSEMKEFKRFEVSGNMFQDSFDIIDTDGESLGLYNFGDNTYYGLMRDFIKKLDDLENEIK